jgi:hypothetical protein
MFPNDAAGGSEKAFESLNYLPARKLGSGLVVGWIEEDEVVLTCGLRQPVFNG